MKHDRTALIAFVTVLTVAFLALAMILVTSTANAHLNPTSLANSNIELETAGHIGGSTGAVFVDGDTAYVGMGNELAILDISDPSMPTRVGCFRPLKCNGGRLTCYKRPGSWIGRGE